MSAYVTQAQILGAISMTDLIALTDDDNTGDINTTVLNQAIANASTDIDGYVANIYDTPFDPVPAAVSNYALAIVCYQLIRRRLTPDEKNIFYSQYKDTIDFLQKVNNGEAHIPQTPARSFTQGAVVARATVFGGSIFSNNLSSTI